MSDTPPLAGACSTPLPPSFALPEDIHGALTDQIGSLRELHYYYDLLEAMISLDGERRSRASLGAILRTLNDELNQQLVALEKRPRQQLNGPSQL